MDKSENSDATICGSMNLKLTFQFEGEEITTTRFEARWYSFRFLTLPIWEEMAPKCGTATNSDRWVQVPILGSLHLVCDLLPFSLTDLPRLGVTGIRCNGTSETPVPRGKKLGNQGVVAGAEVFPCSRDRLIVARLDEWLGCPQFCSQWGWISE